MKSEAQPVRYPSSPRNGQNLKGSLLEPSSFEIDAGRNIGRDPRVITAAARTMSEDWITPRAAADLLGVSYNRAFPILKDADITPRKIGREVTYRRADVEALKQLRAESKANGRVDPWRGRNVADGDEPKRLTTLRPCLCCSRRFSSEGSHNRLCFACRRKAQVDVPECSVSG